MAKRPAKTLRLNFVKVDDRGNAMLQILGSPAEVRMATSPKTFISVREDGITLAPGLGSSVSIQGLPHNMNYGGMLIDLPFPLSIMPTTPFTPFPKQVFMPPLAKIIPFLRDMSIIASSLVL